MIRATAGEPDIEPGLKGDVSEGSRNAVDTVKHNYEWYEKNLILFVIIVILMSGMPAITLCSSYCVSSDLELDSPMDGSCP